MSIANPQHPCILKERTFHVAHASFVRIIGPHIRTHTHIWTYSHLSNKHGGWNKRGGGAKNAKSLNVEGVINVNF